MPSHEEIEHQRALLATYRRSLEHLQIQAASYGGEEFVPLKVANHLTVVRESIGQLKGLLRGWGIPVEDRLGEPAAPPSLAPPPAVPAASELPDLPILDDDAELRPFVAGPPISPPRQFFGRERELRRIFGLLKRLPLQNAALIGPRRSGKTSLLLYLQHITATPATQLRPGQRADWLAEPERYRWAYVNFQDPRMGSREGLL